MVRLHVISAIIDQVLFFKSYYFSKYERILNMISWGKAVILFACCVICLYMRRIAIYVHLYWLFITSIKLL